jgi:hypothetical protein
MQVNAYSAVWEALGSRSKAAFVLMSKCDAVLCSCGGGKKMSWSGASVAGVGCWVVPPQFITYSVVFKASIV